MNAHWHATPQWWARLAAVNVSKIWGPDRLAFEGIQTLATTDSVVAKLATTQFKN